LLTARKLKLKLPLFAVVLKKTPLALSFKAKKKNDDAVSKSSHSIDKNKKYQRASWLFNLTTLLALIKPDPKARAFQLYC